MRPESAWSMSTVGLTAQETAFPIENALLWGGCCHAMAGSKTNWSRTPDLDSFYISMSPPTCPSYGAQQRTPPSHERHQHGTSVQRFPPKKSRPHHLSLSCSPQPQSSSSPGELEQPGSYGGSSPPHTPGRCSKPLPPPPPRHVFEQLDPEADFSTNTDESCRLVPEDGGKSAFRSGVPSRRSFRDCGRVNHAYYDGPLAPQGGKAPRPDTPPQGPQKEPGQEAACPQDKTQRRLRRSQSGPAGSYNKASLLRFSCQKRYMDKAEVPPPIPPRTIRTADPRRWSVEVSPGLLSDEDRPPKIPPRDPLGSPSPKSLPTYSNGVMPSTQSFAPDPNYVSFHRQNSEGSPCILPVTVAGVKDSDTHYYLMPQQDCVEKLFSALEAPPSHHSDHPPRDYHARRSAHVHLV